MANTKLYNDVAVHFLNIILSSTVFASSLPFAKFETACAQLQWWSPEKLSLQIPERALRTMAGSKAVGAAALSLIGVLVVMAMVVESDGAGVCNPNALYPCLRAIQGARPPSPSRQCCNVVKSVDKNCMCNQLKSSSFPAQMVNNGLQLPKKCGRTDLRGFRCGRYTFPY